MIKNIFSFNQFKVEHNKEDKYQFTLNELEEEYRLLQEQRQQVKEIIRKHNLACYLLYSIWCN
jgi:hypothetical protein